MSKLSKVEGRVRRHRRIRKKIEGTGVCPRLAVFKSNNYIYAQVIDDSTGSTIVSASSIEKDVRSKFNGKLNREVSTLIGKLIGERAISKGIKSVVFDRGGFVYHGRVKSLADAARTAGLEF